MTYKSRRTASQRLSGLGFVAGLHVVAIYLVASGLAHQAVETVMGPIETKVLEEAKPKQEELPPPPPKLQTPPPYVPPPDLDVVVEAPPASAASTTAISSVSNKPAPVVQAPAADVEAKLDPRGRRNSLPQEEYPSGELRACHQGEALVSFLILTDGRIGDSRIDKSTGYPALEEWGVKYATQNWRFLPAKKDGQPIPSWKTMKLTFKISRGC